MAQEQSDYNTKINYWVKKVLSKENLKNVSVSIEGNTDKGQGYVGDIIFVQATGMTQDEVNKHYSLVLKCSKKSKVLREVSPIKEVFLNEIFVYEKVLPCFIQFQKEKGVEDIFDNVVKCYGSFVEEESEVLILENIKKSGYELWPKQLPLSRKHVDLVIEVYSKFHATSVALKQHRPKDFEALANVVKHPYLQNSTDEDMMLFCGQPIDGACKVLRGILPDKLLSKFATLKEKITFINGDMLNNQTGLKVILHGDCWNNNFMFLHSNDDKKNPLKVIFLDWQIARCASPVLDLSHFLFSCLSPDDLNDLDNILLRYYKLFINHLKKLDVNNPETLFSYEEFLEDWKNYSKFGIVVATLLLKMVFAENNDIRDIAEVVEKGEHFSETFLPEIRNTDGYIKRLRPFVEYVVNHDLI